MKKLLFILTLAGTLIFLSGNSFAQTSEGGNNNPVIIASPNPFDNELTLSIQEGTKKLTAIRIFDLIGKEVTVIDIRSKTGNFSYKVDFSRLRPGVYFCNIYGEQGLIETKKLFKTSDTL